MLNGLVVLPSVHGHDQDAPRSEQVSVLDIVLERIVLQDDRIAEIPGVIVQGRYDVVCPMITSWELHQAWQKAKYVVVPDAGHSVSEPGIIDALVTATDSFVS